MGGERQAAEEEGPKIKVATTLDGEEGLLRLKFVFKGNRTMFT